MVTNDWRIKGKRSETVKRKKDESIAKTKLFDANFMQIGLLRRKLLTLENFKMSSWEPENQ